MSDEWDEKAAMLLPGTYQSSAERDAVAAALRVLAAEREHHKQYRADYYMRNAALEERLAMDRQLYAVACTEIERLKNG